MSIQTIYTRLVQAGMTPESACGLMGNFQRESAMKVNNVEDRMHRILGMTDEEYTAAVDSGSYVKFAHDGFGYGLYQLTLSSRKAGFLQFVRSRGVSIADETAQVDYCVHELKTDFPKLWAWLKTNRGVATAADRICEEFERPAVNNYGARREAANGFYMTLGGMDVPELGTVSGGASPAPAVEVESYWPPRTLQFGMSGPDVVALQGLLIAHGYPAGITGQFDQATNEQLRAFQTAAGLKADGIVGKKSWAALVKGV